MQRTIDAAPDTREPADDQPAVHEIAPDDHQAAGLVQEEERHHAPDAAGRDTNSLAERPIQPAPDAEVAEDPEPVIDEVVSDVPPETTQELGQKAVDGAGAEVPDEAADDVPADAAALAETELGDAAAPRAEAAAQASSRLLEDEVVFTAMPRSTQEMAAGGEAEQGDTEAGDAAGALDDDPGDGGDRSDARIGEAEQVRVTGEEEVVAGDDQRAGAGDQPPTGNGNDNNGGRGGEGPEDGESPDDEEPGGDDGEEPGAEQAGRQRQSADGGQAEPGAVPAERDPLETLRTHRQQIGEIDKRLDDAIAADDDEGANAAALELVTARDEMDQYIAEQIAAGKLTEDQVEAVRGEPLVDMEPDPSDAAGADEPAERTTDTAAGDDTGDKVDIDLSEHLRPEDDEPSEHDRVMSELRERVDHANKMAERLTSARDAELIAGVPVDEWLVEAAEDAAHEAYEYYNRNDTLLDDIELGIYDTTDGNVHFSINPAIPEVGDTPAADDATGDWPTQPPHYQPDIVDEGDTPLGDTTPGKPENAHDSPPYWDASNWPDGPEGADPKKGGWDINVTDLDDGSGPSGSGSEQQEEVKALSGTVMEHIWNKLSTLHEKIVTKTENRTIERLRIVDGVMKVDLYKVSRIENSPLPSQYYLRTGHTGIRNGIFGGFREQKPIAFKSVYGNNVSAAKILARQERRQQQLHHTRGSNGLMALATAVRTAYGAKADEHRARVIYRHEKSNFEYKQMQQRQHLRFQLQDTHHMRGAQREERRQEIRDELRRLRHEEHRFRQHHRTVKAQRVHRRAARSTLKASGKAIKGGAKGTAWAARKGAKGTAKVARRTTETAANRWAARQAGPGGTNRPPRNPGGRRPGHGPRRTPNQSPKAPSGSGNQPNSEEE